MISWYWLIACINAPTALSSNFSPMNTVSFVLKAFSPDEECPKAPRLGKPRAFSGCETTTIEDKEPVKSPISPPPLNAEGIIPSVLFKRITKLQCWSDLKTWLKKYPEIAKQEFDSRQTPLTEYFSDAEFDVELIELILAHVIGPSVDDWLLLLTFIDFFMEHSQVPAILSVINRAISLGKNEKHFSTLFHRILKEAEKKIFNSKQDKFGRLKTPYELLESLAGEVPGFANHEALFPNLRQGGFSEFQLKNLFFFEASVQVAVIKAYFENNGYVYWDGIIKFNLLEAASEFSLSAEAFELILSRLEVDKLDFKIHEKVLLVRDPMRFENVLYGCIKRAMFGNHPREAQLLLARFPELRQFVDTFISEIPSAQFMADAIWIKIVQESVSSFRWLRQRMFDECEFLAVCAMKKGLDRTELLRAAFSDLRKQGNEADLVKSLRMVLKYSDEDEYDWAEILFIQCRNDSYEQLLKLFEEVKCSGTQAQIDYLNSFLRK